MRKYLIFAVLLVVAEVNGQTASQDDLQRERTSNPTLDNPLIDSAQSSVYMEFKGVGKCPPSVQGETNDRIWLALRNNTRWSVLISANGVEDDCYGDASPFYRVEANGSMVPEGPIPDGHWFDVASRVEIGPGEILTFSVPRSHLDPGLSIRVDFEFSWEKNNRYSRHSSYLDYWDLPDALRNKEKEKKLKCGREPCLHNLESFPPPKPPELPEPPALSLPIVKSDLPAVLQRPNK